MILLLFAQIVLGDGHVRLDDSSVGSVLPSGQTHVRTLRVSTVIDDFCCCLFGYSIVHYVLYRLEENSGFFGVFVIVRTALAVDVRYLLIVTTFAYTYFTYAVEQFIEVISPEYIFPFRRSSSSTKPLVRYSLRIPVAQMRNCVAS